MRPTTFRRSLGMLVALAAGAAVACSDPTAPGLKAAPTLATKPPSNGGTIPTVAARPLATTHGPSAQAAAGTSGAER